VLFVGAENLRIAALLTGLMLLLVFAAERLLLPNLVDTVVTRHHNHYLAMLQIAYRTTSEDQQRVAVIEELLSEQQQLVGWRGVIYDKSETLVKERHNYSGAETLIIYPERPNSMAFGLIFDSGAIAQEITATFRQYEVLAAGFALIMLLVMYALQLKMVLYPLQQITVAASRMVEGDYQYPLPPVDRRYSLARLVSAFRHMRQALARQHRELESQVQEKWLIQQRLTQSHAVAQLGCWEWIREEDKVWFSDSLVKILGLTPASHCTIEEFLCQVHPADQKDLLKMLYGPIGESSSFSTDFRISSEQGYGHIHLVASAQKDSDGSLRLFGTCQDITERKEIEASLRKLSSAITSSGSSVMITDIIGTVEYVNPKFTETTGYKLSEIVGKQPEMLSRKWMSPERYESMWQSILVGKHWRGDLQSVRRDGTSFWSIVSISPINNEYGELTHFVIVSEDVTELKDAHAQMEKLALYDELTGLPNRRMFFRQLTQLLEQDVVPTAAVMLLDLDHFKTVNDTQGHPVGDKLLVEVAERIGQVLTINDTAARLGGDEFAVLIHPVETIEQVEEVAERLLREVSKPYYINDHDLQISTSLGLAWLPKDGDMPDTILKHADLAMYQAKEMGRNQYQQFTEQLHLQLQSYIRFSREMPAALANGDFSLRFQPKVELASNKIVGAEALLRWEHPELGIVSPVEFISIAEETGFIVPLGSWVIEEACRSLAELRKLGFTELNLAVNLSSRQFRDPSLMAVIRAALERYQLDPHYLEIEITETLLMQDINQAIDTLKEIQQLGIRVAIDDFGIGYSSFNYLKTLPINVLKVDREFIKDIPDHLDDMEITAAIISMAHKLNLEVVAEGIETLVQREFLEEHRCDIGQGYLFGKPMLLDEMAALLGRD